MFGILVWDSGFCDSNFGFRFGTKVRDSCLGFRLWDSGLRFRFGIQILHPGL